MHRARVGVFLIVLVAMAATTCQQNGPAALSDADKAAIKKTADQALALFSRPTKDWPAFVKFLYAADAMVLPPNAPAVKGHEAIIDMVQSFPPFSDYRQEPQEIEGSGNLAYDCQSYSMTFTPPGIPPFTDTGKLVWIWRKQADGSWKLWREIYNSDRPVPGLVIPTGAVAADASPEIKKLGDIVGRWRMDGTFRPEPKAPAGPVANTIACDWFTGGRQVSCRMSGTEAGARYEEIYTYFYDPKAKAYRLFSTVNDGSSTVQNLVIEPATWIHTGEAQVGGKPAKVRFTLANMSPAGGSWKGETSVAGGPWMTMGEGKYAKAR
jgi:ketosteroid isomerase-like protein